MATVSPTSSLAQFLAPESRLSGHELDLALMEMAHAARECEAAEAVADRTAGLFGEDDQTPPPTAGALQFPEVLTLPDFVLIASIDAADRHDPALRVDGDFDRYLDEASAEMVRRLDLAQTVTTHGYGSRQHCDAQARSMSTPDLLAALRGPETALFSVRAASAYCVEVVRRMNARSTFPIERADNGQPVAQLCARSAAEALRIAQDQVPAVPLRPSSLFSNEAHRLIDATVRPVKAPAAKRKRRRRWVTKIHRASDGSFAEKRVPNDAEPAYVRPGMIVMCFEGSAKAVVIECTPDHCISTMEDGSIVTLPWHEVWTAHCLPDPAALAAVA